MPIESVLKHSSINSFDFQDKKYYSTKFEPPKKESKEKKLSENIKKFLAQREAEERRHEKEAKRKYNDLMAQRTDRDKNKIKKMLKVTKSANRSVLDDAVDNTNTALTLQGPEQPDEDDYGYVSHEASSMYKNLMDKYKTIPEEKKFSDSSARHGSKTDLSSTKDRVRAAIMREREDAKSGRKRSTPSSTAGSTPSSTHSSEHRHRSRKNLYDPQTEREEEERRRREEEEQKRKARLKKAPPPPMLNFQNLLKLAEQKQHEPLEIEVQTKAKEPERLLTSKEKREIEEKKAYLAEKERRRNMPAGKQADGRVTSETGKTVNKMAPNGRIPKLNATEARPSTNRMSSDTRKSSSSINPAVPKPSLAKPNSEHKSTMRPPSAGSSLGRSGSSGNSDILRSTLTKSSTASPSNGNRRPEPKHLPKVAKAREFPPKDMQRPTKDLKTKSAMPSKEVKAREFPPRDVVKTREFPPRDVVKTREFPPRDVHRNGNGLKRKPMPPPKRRIIDDEDESEYDSEMDDFIDDDPQVRRDCNACPHPGHRQRTYLSVFFICRTMITPNTSKKFSATINHATARTKTIATIWRRISPNSNVKNS